MNGAQILPRARQRLAMIDAAAPVKDAADLMSKPHVDLVVVCGPDGGMVGVLTKTHIVSHIRQCIGDGCTVGVNTIMTSQVISCGLSDPLEDVWSVMKSCGLQRIPVVDGNRPVGVIYARDALQCLLGEVESDEALLRDYVMGVGYR